MNPEVTTFSWLHLTDLHQGLDSIKWMWPNVEARFYEDLVILHKLCGPWDFVIFTGDLTQKGTKEEFKLLTATLEKLWQHLKELGSDPILLSIPGNHDLQRPVESNPEALVLTNWENYPAIHSEFWSNKKSPYRKAIDKAFKGYTDWVGNHPFLKPSLIKLGLLPGDFSATIKKGNKKLGIVGLNSAYLQLFDGNFEKRLNLGYEQLHAVCNEKVIEWIDEHDAALIMTHHPPEWLSDSARQRLNAEIAPPERFAVHFFGHMHEHAIQSLSVGGASQWRRWQGNSLFGLENWSKGNGGIRSHGYAAGKIEISKDSANLRMWPRKAYKHQAGYWQLGPDQSFTLDAEQAVPKESIICRQAIKEAKKQPIMVETELMKLISDSIINTGHPAFIVRRVEEKKLLDIAFYVIGVTPAERQREILSLVSIFSFETQLFDSVTLFLVNKTRPTDNIITFDQVSLLCRFSLVNARRYNLKQVSAREFWEQLLFWIPQMPATVHSVTQPVKLPFLEF